MHYTKLSLSVWIWVLLTIKATPKTFPNAERKIALDHFHVAKMLTEAITGSAKKVYSGDAVNAARGTPNMIERGSIDSYW